MYSPSSSTSGRGRSRFSKVLPVPPGEAATASEKSPAALTSRSLRTDLPPLPSDAVKAPMAIPRRPVGGGVGGEVKNEKPARAASIASVSSVYSDSPGVSRSPSDSSRKDSLSGVDSEDGPTPPLPPKDKDRQTPNQNQNQNQHPNEKPQTTHKLSSNSISSFDNALLPTEIWRRRSAKSEHSISFSDLKLQKSNGSTASPPRRQEQPTERPQLPRSITGRKPVPARPAPPQPEFMGNKISKLRKKGSREDSSNDEAPVPARTPPPQLYDSIQRLPTPEYLKADKQQPITPSILSPVSPFTPPDDKPPLVPRKSESRSLAISHGSSDATIVAPTASTPENDPPVSNNLLAAHSRDGSDTLTITSEAVVMSSPQPQKPVAATRILTPQLSSGKASPMSLPSPASHAAYFPKVNSPAAQGTIFPGPALDRGHFDCYQSHKLMRGSNNKVCSISCMMCQKKDTDRRWRCAWCCLSACGNCMRVLDSVPGKDLRLALEKIGGR
ncbi:hypothetical protein BKA65DRAFT_189157 [Rhexocercosporidium sp. MPI-PUGE-AT-0058]|nr:hypothetical protein BKA65DRAFT_189157 [Rhexocercosporidium sp. MPI-PUGE-AT-0058]